MRHMKHFGRVNWNTISVFLCVDKKINQLLFFVLKGIRCKICWSFTIVSHSTYDNFFSILLPFSTSILDFMPHTKSCTRNERWNENETVFMWVCRYRCKCVRSSICKCIFVTMLLLCSFVHIYRSRNEFPVKNFGQ